MLASVCAYETELAMIQEWRVPGLVMSVCLAFSTPVGATIYEDCDQADDPTLAVEACTTLIESGEESSRTVEAAYLNRGMSYADLGEYQLAIGDLEAAIRLNPRYATAYRNLGRVLIHTEQFEQAVRALDDAIRLEPESAVAYVDRGVAYRGLGQLQQAIDNYDEAIRLDASLELAHINRFHAQRVFAYRLYSEDQPNEALPYIEQALEFDPEHELSIGVLAHIYAALGRPDDALAAFERLIAMNGEQAIPAFKEALVGHGYSPGPMDGEYGPEARDALYACLQAGCRLLW